MSDERIKSTSTDISFCSSDCINTTCDRCKEGKLYKRVKYPYSVADFSRICDYYMRKTQE